MIEMRQNTHSPRDCRQLTNHKRDKLSEGHLLSLFCILNVENGAFTFATRKQLKTELNLIYSQFKRFGLEMHIERGSKTSKTECVFFPPPEFLENIVLHQIQLIISTNCQLYIKSPLIIGKLEKRKNTLILPIQNQFL